MHISSRPLGRSSRLRGALLLVVVGLSVALGAGIGAADFPPDTPAADLPLGVAWGNNDYGKLGDATDVSRTTAVALGPGGSFSGRQVSSISSGRQSACAVVNGSVYCWGFGGHGELGNGASSDSAVPVQVGGPLAKRFVSSVSVGADHACAIADGRAFCWGDNLEGQLGSSFDGPASTPIEVDMTGAAAGKRFTQISTGFRFTCAVASGAPLCWGDNQNGQLGNGTVVDSPAPVAVTADLLKGQPVTSITAGSNHACLLAGGQAACWGVGAFGRLGNNSTTNAQVPVPVDTNGLLSGLTVTAISAGGSNTCVIAGKGGVRRPYCWGTNVSGNLGDGSAQEFSAVPVQVDIQLNSSVMKVSSISTGGSGACAIAGGKGYCWGSNTWGRIGDGTTITRPVAAPVSTVGVLLHRRLQQISAEGNFTDAIAVTPAHFTDVTSSYSFYDEVSWIAGSGIAQGYTDGTYGPTLNIQRQAMAAFLFRFNRLATRTPDCDPATPRKFTDVPASNQFCGAIEWLANNKIIPGGGKFSPGTPLTRGTMADWIFRTFHPGVTDQPCVGSTFEDVTPAVPQCGNIEWLASVGITNGFVDGTYQPTAPIHRDAMAAMFQRTAELAAH